MQKQIEISTATKMNDFFKPDLPLLMD